MTPEQKLTWIKTAFNKSEVWLYSSSYTTKWTLHVTVHPINTEDEHKMKETDHATLASAIDAMFLRLREFIEAVPSVMSENLLEAPVEDETY